MISSKSLSDAQLFLYDFAKFPDALHVVVAFAFYVVDNTNM